MRCCLMSLVRLRGLNPHGMSGKNHLYAETSAHPCCLQAQVMLGMVPMPASAAEAVQMNGGPPPQYDAPYDSQPPPAGGYKQGGRPPAYDATPYEDRGAPQPYGSAPMQADYAYGGGDTYGGIPQYDSSAPDYVPPQGYDAPGAYGQPAYGGGDPRQDYGADPRQPPPQQYPQQAPYSPPQQAPAPVQPKQLPAAAQAPAQAQLDAEQQKGVVLHTLCMHQLLADMPCVHACEVARPVRTSACCHLVPGTLLACM